MSSKTIHAVVCGLLLSFLPHSGFAQSLQEKLSKVETAQAEFVSRMQGLQLYDKYINQDPLANLTAQDLTALNLLIRTTNAQDLRLYCHASTEQIKSPSLIESDRVCKNEARVAFVLTPRGQVLNITSALQKSLGDKCTVLDRKLGQYAGAVVNSNGSEAVTSFVARDARNLETSTASVEQKLTMAVATCCASEAKGGNCLQRFEKAFNSLKN